MDPPDDITEQWFEACGGKVKSARRMRGEPDYPWPGHMTLVEAIIWWWEHHIRPGLSSDESP